MTPEQITPISFFLLMLKASMVSTGGIGNVPSLHSDFLARGWASDSDFAQALTIGQLSPGPTGLWVVSFGYLTFGLSGALLTTLAIIIPPLFILCVRSVHAKLEDHPAAQGFIRGLGLAGAGTFVYVLNQLMMRTGVSVFTVLVAICACGLATLRKLPSIVIIGLAAIAGAMIH